MKNSKKKKTQKQDLNNESDDEIIIDLDDFMEEELVYSNVDQINVTNEEYVKAESKDKIEVFTKNQNKFRSLCGVLMVFFAVILFVDFFTNDDGASLFWSLVLGIWGIKLIHKSRSVEPKDLVKSKENNKKTNDNTAETGNNIFIALLTLFVVGVGIALIVALGPLWIIAILLFFLIFK